MSNPVEPGVHGRGAFKAPTLTKEDLDAMRKRADDAPEPYKTDLFRLLNALGK